MIVGVLAGLTQHPQLLGTFMVLGVLVFVLVGYAMAWRLERHRSHFPWIAITGCGIVFALARIGHLTADDPDRALAFIRAQYAITLLLPGLALASVEILAEVPTVRATKVLTLVTVGLACACLVTPGFVVPPIVVRRDALGHEYFAGTPGPLVASVVPLCAWLVVAFRRRVRRMPTRLRPLRRSFRTGLVVFLVLGINDTLLGAGVIRSIHLFDYAFVYFAFMASNFARRRTMILHHELEQMVAEQHAELEATGASLETTSQRLVLSEGRYRHLADATREGVLLCDRDRVVDTNRALRELLQISDGDTIGKVVDLVGPPDRDRVARLLAGDPGPIEVVLCRGEASVAVSIRAIPTPEGSPGTRVLLVRDVSGERDLQQRLLRADRLVAVGTLAAGTAHEINNPLCYVMGNADLLQEEISERGTDLPPDFASFASRVVGEISAGADRMSRIVKDLMKLARERPTDEGPVDVCQTLEACLEMAANQVRHRATVVKELEVVPKVFASEGRLFQVFLNLIVNAAHAIPEGNAMSNEIRIRTSCEGGRVIVAISDTGVGMTPDVRDRIFDPFFTTKDVGQGTGLGLSISLGIVTSLGGDIDIVSERGRGTTMYVQLPATAAQSSDRTPAPLAVADGAALRVLVVDDEPLVAESMARMLRGHSVDVVLSGREALQRLRTARYDVVLCDLAMPDVSGMEVHMELAARHDDVLDRFVFMTGGAFTERARDFLEHEAKRWLPKPIRLEALRRVVVEVGSARRD